MGNFRTMMGQAQSQLLEITFLLQWLIARSATHETQKMPPPQSALPHRETVPVQAFPDFGEDVESALFKTQQKLVDYEVQLERLAKGIPRKLEKTALKMHSKAVGLFRGYLILTGLNVLVTGSAVAVFMVSKLM